MKSTLIVPVTLLATLAFYGTKEQRDAFLREPGVRPMQTGAARPAPTPAPPKMAAARPQESIAEPASAPAE